MNDPTKRMHLSRLEHAWTDNPIQFVTACTHGRRHELANDALHDICREVWARADQLYGWIVGRYVLMPDHAHFFCAPRARSRNLQKFVGKWKEWTAKHAHRRYGVQRPLWQAEFFDHVLRSTESYEQKWKYVRENPVRARLVRRAEDWPFQGEIHTLRFD